jgi:hypothetical protein
VRGTACVLAAVVFSLAESAALNASPPVAPVPIGAGSLYHPPPRGSLVAGRRRVGSLGCSSSTTSRFGTHLELFGRGLVTIVPAGIGIAPPLRADGPFIIAGACSYAARTREPTGVIEIAGGARVTLGDFFALWAQPLGPRRLAGFRAIGAERVRAWVNGLAWRGDPRAIPLRPHDEIVLELGAFVTPHASYRFRKGL